MVRAIGSTSTAANKNRSVPSRCWPIDARERQDVPRSESYCITLVLANSCPQVIKLILMDGAGLSAEDYEALRLGHIAELDDLKANLVCRLFLCCFHALISA
jgi:hypothetical protein